MDVKFTVLAAAAILAGCCSCPQPCPSLVNNPAGGCPCCGEGGCACKPSCDVCEYNVPYGGCRLGTGSGEHRADWLQAGAAFRGKTSDGYVQVQVPLKNLTVSPMRLKYRFVWLDRLGNKVKDLDHDHWESVSLVPGGDGRVSSIAAETDCTDYELHIRYVP